MEFVPWCGILHGGARKGSPGVPGDVWGLIYSLRPERLGKPAPLLPEVPFHCPLSRHQCTDDVDLLGPPFADVARDMRVVPPQPGVIPLSTSGIPQMARSVAMTKSQAMVISNPPPTVHP